MSKNKTATAKPSISVKWNMINVGFQLVLRLTATIYFMKFINPETYGVYTLAVIFLEGAKILTERGYPGAIIQNPKIGRKHFRYFLTQNFKTGFLLWIFFLFVEFVFVKEQGAELWVLSSSILMISLISTPRAFNQKELKFKKIACIEVFSLAVGLITGFVMIQYGYGLWALVLAYLVNTGLTAFLFLLNEKELFSTLEKAPEAFFQFSKSLFVNNIVLYLAKFIDQFITSFFFGLQVQGLYNRTLAFISVPVTGVSRSISEVMLPYLSLKEPNKTVSFYFRTIQIFLFFLIPGLFCIYFLMDFVVDFVGLEWRFLKSYALYIIVASIPLSLNFLFGALLVFSGDHKLVYQAMILKRVSSISGIVIGAFWGIEGLIIGKIISEFTNFLINVYQTELILRESYKAQAKVYLEASIAISLCLAVVFVEIDNLLSVCMILAVVLLVYLVLDRKIFTDSIRIFNELIKAV